MKNQKILLMSLLVLGIFAGCQKNDNSSSSTLLPSSNNTSSTSSSSSSSSTSSSSSSSSTSSLSSSSSNPISSSSNPIVSTSTPDVCDVDSITAINFGSLADKDVEEGVAFNFLAGVTVTGTLASGGQENLNKWLSVVVTHDSTEYSETFNTSTLAIGETVDVKYLIEVEDDCLEIAAGVSVEKIITLTIIPELPKPIVFNGDFNAGLEGWDKYGNGTLAIEQEGENKFISVNVLATSGATYDPRLNTATSGAYGMKLEKDSFYQISFKAKAVVARSIVLQVGELLTVDPYFKMANAIGDYKSSKTVDITTEWATYSHVFSMAQETNLNEHITLEVGTPTPSLLGKVYFDDIVVEEVAAPDDLVAPVISGSTHIAVALNADFDPLAGITALDNRDGNISSNITYTIKTFAGVDTAQINTTTAGKYIITYNVKDSSNNAASFTRAVYVNATGTIDNLFAETMDVTFGTEADAKAALKGKIAYWNDKVDGVTINDFSCTANEGTLTYAYDITTTSSPRWWGLQLFYVCNNPAYVAGTTYFVSFKILPETSGSIMVNNKIYNLVAGQETIISHTVAGSATTIALLFAIDVGGGAGVYLPNGSHQLYDFFVG